MRRIAHHPFGELRRERGSIGAMLVNRHLLRVDEEGCRHDHGGGAGAHAYRTLQESTKDLVHPDSVGLGPAELLYEGRPCSLEGGTLAGFVKAPRPRPVSMDPG